MAARRKSLYSLQKRFYDPQVVAGVIVGISTGIPALISASILYKTSIDRDVLSNELKTHYEEVHKWQKQVKEEDDKWRKQVKYENDIYLLDKSLDETKKNILEILYGDTHRRISDDMAHLLSKLSSSESKKSNYDKFETKEDYQTYYDKNYDTAKQWYIDFKKKVNDENTSVEEKRKSPLYQINMARSAVRDNFSRLSSLLEDYSETLERRNTLAVKLNDKEMRRSLLKIDEAKVLLDRYDRFVRHTKPFDQAMGYLAKDGFIYKQGEKYPLFFEKVLSNLVEKDKKELVNYVNIRTEKDTNG